MFRGRNNFAKKSINRAFLVHISGTKIFPDMLSNMLFSQDHSPKNIYKKPFPEKSSDKTFKEITNVYWNTVQIMQVLFVKHPLILWKITKKNSLQISSL